MIIIDDDHLDGFSYNGEIFLARNVHMDNGVLTTPEGHISIYVDGNYHFVCCNDQFMKKQLILADSACRQLGYTNADDVQCSDNK